MSAVFENELGRRRRLFPMNKGLYGDDHRGAAMSSAQIQPVRGMNDVLPADIGAWQHVEGTFRELLTAYGYEEFRTPIVEHQELFKRAIGELTDVVEKEMYTFVDQGGESLTLRPESTAGMVRAVISNGLLRGAR